MADDFFMFIKAFIFFFIILLLGNMTMWVCRELFIEKKERLMICRFLMIIFFNLFIFLYVMQNKRFSN